MMERPRLRAREYERQKRLDEQNNNKIQLFRTCIVCGQKIPLETISPDEKVFFKEHGAHCKKCIVGARENAFRSPWIKK